MKCLYILCSNTSLQIYVYIYTCIYHIVLYTSNEYASVNKYWRQSCVEILYIYTCICIIVYNRFYICIYTYIYICVQVYYMCVCMYICVYVVYIYSFTYTRTLVWFSLREPLPRELLKCCHIRGAPKSPAFQQAVRSGQWHMTDLETTQHTYM